MTWWTLLGGAKCGDQLSNNLGTLLIKKSSSRKLKNVHGCNNLWSVKENVAHVSIFKNHLDQFVLSVSKI